MMIPKEQQSAYQRWEMACFGDDRPSARARRAEQEAAEARERAAAEVAAAHEVEMPGLALPSVEELEAIREAARLEGYEQGLEEGRAAGHAEGHADALRVGMEQTGIELAHLRAVAASFSQALAQADESVAQDLLELGLRLARGMVQTAFVTRPELILEVVREAIAQLPVMQQPAQLMLHPEDAQLVRNGMADELEDDGWRIIEDAALERGGCLIETGSNRIDAQASTRWQRLTQALGRDISWLES